MADYRPLHSLHNIDFLADTDRLLVQNIAFPSAVMTLEDISGAYSLATLAAGIGGGDFFGPTGPITADAILLFDGTTGKLGKDSGILLSALQAVAGKGAANGYAGLDASSRVVQAVQVIHETGDPVDLTVSDIADGEFLTRSGTTIAGAAAPGAGTARQEQLATEVITGTDTALAATLSFTPLANAGFVLYFNSLKANQGTGLDYTISGTTITWLASSGTALDMDTGDVVSVTYRS